MGQSLILNGFTAKQYCFVSECGNKQVVVFEEAIDFCAGREVKDVAFLFVGGKTDTGRKSPTFVTAVGYHFPVYIKNLSNQPAG
jgi:hypothetical protein